MIGDRASHSGKHDHATPRDQGLQVRDLINLRYTELILRLTLYVVHKPTGYGPAMGRSKEDPA
jgi:hypothetical protein